MKKVTVNRSRWLFGGTPGISVLRDEEGRSCCLGFAMAQVCGLRYGRLEELSAPSDVAYTLKKTFKPFTYGKENSKFSREAMGINDDESLS